MTSFSQDDAAPATPFVGEQIGHYRVVARLGAGGMGEVWLAEDITLKRKAAIKLLPAEFTADAARVRRFEQEARAASALNHPNIVTVYEVGRTNGRHYLVTEFIDGQMLRQALNREGMPIAQALDIALQIAAALAAAHEVGIVHRDIKPENVMVRRDGYVKVLDFGLAKLVEPARPELDTEAPTIARVTTGAGVVMGTANYMSPEQARGLKVDARSDIFSLGIVLYEMLTGALPFSGKTTMDTLAAILTREHAPLEGDALHALPEAAFDELQRIVNKSLRKEPDERYQTIKDLLLDLKSLKQEIEFQAKLERSLPSGALAARPTRRRATTGHLAQAGTPTAQVTDAQPTHSSVQIILGEMKRHRRGVAATFIVFALLLAAGGYGSYQLIRRNRAEPPAPELKLTRLTATGDVHTPPAPAIAPNGEYAAYILKVGDQQSLWLKQVGMNNGLQLVPPAAVNYEGVAFSPDGRYIYYAASSGREVANLYRVPLLPGPATNLLTDIDSAVSFSPDGARLTYVNASYAQLMIAGADGRDARKLAAHRPEEGLYLPAWSPDGETIACSAFRRKTGEAELVAVRVRDGQITSIGARRWGRVQGVGWLADGSGLIVNASEPGTRSYQLWRIAYPEGTARRLTNDLSNYYGVSLTRDARHLLSVRQEQVMNVWVTAVGNAPARQVTFDNGANDGRELAWTPDDKIVYSASSGGGTDLWIADADGSNRRQLTLNAGRNYAPTVSADGRTIVFVSDRTGTPTLWRMDRNGGDLRQLTADAAGMVARPDCSPVDDGVLYTVQHDQQNSVWRVPLAGGTPVPIVTTSAQWGLVSPDGKLVACHYQAQGPMSPYQLALFPAEGGVPSKLMALPAVIKSAVFRWLPDGRGISYIDARDGVYNIWSQPLAGGAPRPLTDFKADRIFSFAWSRDGKRLACARGRDTSDLVLVDNFH